MNKTIVERKIERLASIAVTDSKIVFSQNSVQSEIVSNSHTVRGGCGVLKNDSVSHEFFMAYVRECQTTNNLAKCKPLLIFYIVHRSSSLVYGFPFPFHQMDQKQREFCMSCAHFER